MYVMYEKIDIFTNTYYYYLNYVSIIVNYWIKNKVSIRTCLIDTSDNMCI